MNQRACLFGAALMMACAASQVPAASANPSAFTRWPVVAGGRSRKRRAERSSGGPLRVPRPSQRRCRGSSRTRFPVITASPGTGRNSRVPPIAHKDGRTLLRFWQVDYKCDVWLNDTAVGSHEGGESVFVFDVTGIVKPGQTNRLAVRVLNPTHEPMDGIVLNETPHRNKALPYRSGSAWNQGGIWDSVEVLTVPQAWVEDLFVRPDWKTGEIRIQANIRNAGPAPLKSRVQFSVAPAATGETLTVTCLEPRTEVG